VHELYDYDDYRRYLIDWIDSRPKKGRGIRAELARALGSPVSHISQVLNGVSDFSFEQAEDISLYIGHNSEEADFFVQLLHLARAGTQNLKTRIIEKINKAREKRFNLKNRLDIKESISSEHTVQFYSSWIYVAIHIALTIKSLQTKSALANYFGLSLVRCSEILEYMTVMGLVENHGESYKVTTQRIHLGNESPMLLKHHINWRLQAIQSIEKLNAPTDLHYSSVVSLSTSDVQKIKSILVKTIDETKKIIHSSKEEELHSFCLDFFKV
jgi:uncharacterized protein (TIGR02147 family)